MRKFAIIIVVLITLLLLGNTQSNFTGIALKNYPNKSTIVDSLSTPSKKLLCEMIYLPNTPFDEREATAIVTRLNRLPLTMLSKINQQGIKIKLFTGSLTDNPTAKHLQGVKPRGYVGNTTWDDVPGIGGSKTILVKIGASKPGNGHSSVNLELHELAHSIDRYVYNEIRNNSRFLKIWEQERGVLFRDSTYLTTFPEEYFAETFAMYFLNDATNEKLQRLAPKTFEFLQVLQ